MRNEDYQILAMLEKGMAPREISEALGVENTVVAYRIATVPTLASAARGLTSPGEAALSDLEKMQALAIQTIESAMRSEDKKVALAAAKYALDKFVPNATKPEDNKPKGNTYIQVNVDKRRQAAEKKAALNNAREHTTTVAGRSPVVVPFGELLAASHG